MSAKKMGQVYDLDLAHPEQSVLLALADHADHEGRNAHPGVDLLVWKTGYSERQVIRILRSLEESRLIIAEGKVSGGRGRTTVYRVCPENGVKKAAFEPRRGAAKPRHKSQEKDDKKGDILTLFSEPITSDTTPEKGDILTPFSSTERVTFPATKGDISSTERVTFEAEKGDISDAHIVSTHARLNRQEPSGEPSAAATRAHARESQPLIVEDNAAAAEDVLRIEKNNAAEESPHEKAMALPLLVLTEEQAECRAVGRSLREGGVSRQEADLLCAEATSGQLPFTLADIRDQIEWLPYRNAQKPGYWLPIYIRRGEAKPREITEAEMRQAAAENRKAAAEGSGSGRQLEEDLQCQRSAFLGALSQHERLAIFEEADAHLMAQSAWREYVNEKGKEGRSYQALLKIEVNKIIDSKIGASPLSQAESKHPQTGRSSLQEAPP